MNTDDFILIEYNRIPIKPNERWLTCAVKTAINTKNCYRHYGGKYSRNACQAKETLIAVAESDGKNADAVTAGVHLAATMADKFTGKK